MPQECMTRAMLAAAQKTLCVEKIEDLDGRHVRAVCRETGRGFHGQIRYDDRGRATIVPKPLSRVLEAMREEETTDEKARKEKRARQKPTAWGGAKTSPPKRRRKHVSAGICATAG